VVVVEGRGPEAHREADLDLVAILPAVRDAEVRLRGVRGAGDRNTVDGHQVLLRTTKRERGVV
jgi:hypothetical protein